MSERTRFIGLDVHKASITVAVAGAFGDPEDHGTIANDPAAVRKLLRRLGGPDVRLEVAYEAGPTGYALHRQLTAMGIACMVVAPSLIPVRPGDRIKTDGRDAAKLARLLRSGDLTPVWVPDEAHEALRDLVRARDDAKADQLRAKHRLSKFLLRRAIASAGRGARLEPGPRCLARGAHLRARRRPGRARALRRGRARGGRAGEAARGRSRPVRCDQPARRSSWPPSRRFAASAS